MCAVCGCLAWLVHSYAAKLMLRTTWAEHELASECGWRDARRRAAMLKEGQLDAMKVLYQKQRTSCC